MHDAGRIRYVVSRAETEEALSADLGDELRFLETADPAQVDTTLIIHPAVLADFLDYNDYLDVADALVEKLGYLGVFQVASFHPSYQFAGTAPEDVSNRTNQSPYPMLHLLREASVERAVAEYPDADQISQRNIETMRRLEKPGPPSPLP